MVEVQRAGRSADRWLGSMDERKAYRQIAVRPDHWRWSVISLKEPSLGRIAFFVMVGH